MIFLKNKFFAKIDMTSLQQTWDELTNEKLRTREINKRQTLTIEQTRVRVKIDGFRRFIDGLRQRRNDLETDARLSGCSVR